MCPHAEKIRTALACSVVTARLVVRPCLQLTVRGAVGCSFAGATPLPQAAQATLAACLEALSLLKLLQQDHILCIHTSSSMVSLMSGMVIRDAALLGGDQVKALDSVALL